MLDRLAMQLCAGRSPETCSEPCDGCIRDIHNVLSVLREPSEAMNRALAKSQGYNPDEISDDPLEQFAGNIAKHGYQAMIDEAMKGSNDAD